MEDVRDVIFQHIHNRCFRAVLTAERAGVLAGAEAAMAQAAALGVKLEMCKRDGDDIGHGERVGNLTAGPKEIALAEEQILGTLGKASGIATAARTAVQLAENRSRIVSGSWKKMPPAIKDMVRQSVAIGGASFRITTPPMIYIDKNYLRMLGSVQKALAACAQFTNHTKVVQIRGEEISVSHEVEAAVRGGADILMVDTGVRTDLTECLEKLSSMGARQQVEVAFAGNVKLTDIPDLAGQADILCIGKEIVDARLLDWKMDVIGEVE